MAAATRASSTSFKQFWRLFYSHFGGDQVGGAELTFLKNELTTNLAVYSTQPSLLPLLLLLLPTGSRKNIRIRNRRADGGSAVAVAADDQATPLLRSLQ